MKDQSKFEHCKKCQKELIDNYCSSCGHPKKLKRINQQYIIDEIRSVFNLDKGLLYTIRELLVRPGKIIREFIFEDRNRLVKPVVFIIINSLIFSILNFFLDFEFNYLMAEVEFEDMETPTVTIIFKWIQNNLGIVNILLAFFLAFWTRILFRKSYYNFYERLILICYANGVVMLIYSVIIMLFLLNFLTGTTTFLTILGFVYYSWAIGQFFEGKKYINYLKAFLSYIFGMLSFIITALGIGVLIDFIIKNSS